MRSYVMDKIYHSFSGNCNIGIQSESSNTYLEIEVYITDTTVSYKSVLVIFELNMEGNKRGLVKVCINNPQDNYIQQTYYLNESIAKGIASGKIKIGRHYICTR